MSSSPQPVWKRIVTGAVVVIGMVLLVRLGAMAMGSFRSEEAMPMEQVRAILKKGAEVEREIWEKSWRESGAPPPPGGFDAAWKRARGTMPDGAEVKAIDAAHGQGSASSSGQSPSPASTGKAP
ncbi:hypothetical protein Pan44_49990 [Caulifigura coniformis]|uniref:Uncharacterized protein n=1 Tax=Caulifigura coniformis TaxID=2527983 RepID=A0A517SLE5_9PLAN|nr:hypothetical protein [Caulifigura coniformis]QDT56936.1 hypothetical protein Pan44_49990 [Caulifigura coniformis]